MSAASALSALIAPIAPAGVGGTTAAVDDGSTDFGAVLARVKGEGLEGETVAVVPANDDAPDSIPVDLPVSLQEGSAGLPGALVSLIAPIPAPVAPPAGGEAADSPDLTTSADSADPAPLPTAETSDGLSALLPAKPGVKENPSPTSALSLPDASETPTGPQTRTSNSADTDVQQKAALTAIDAAARAAPSPVTPPSVAQRLATLVAIPARALRAEPTVAPPAVGTDMVGASPETSDTLSLHSTPPSPLKPEVPTGKTGISDRTAESPTRPNVATTTTDDVRAAGPSGSRPADIATTTRPVATTPPAATAFVASAAPTIEPAGLPAPGTASATPATSSSAPALPTIASGLSSLTPATVEATAQIAAQITRRLEGRSTRFEMSLSPDDLGRVDVSLDIDADGQLAARLAFDNPAAATDLRGRADELRRQLEEAGFTVSRDGLNFSERDAGAGSDRRQSRAEAYAARRASIAQAEATPVLPSSSGWISLTLTPTGVDMKV